MKIGLLLLFAAGCATTATPPARALCYAAADQKAQARVMNECKIGDERVKFSECPAKAAIMDQLQSEQEACK